MPPEIGNRMVKVQEMRGKVQDQNMVTARRTAWPLLGGCSALLSGLSPRGVPSQAADLHNVHDTALPMRGGMRSKRKSMLGHCVFTVRLLSLRVGSANQAAYRVPPSRALTDAGFHSLKQASSAHS